MSLVEIRNKKTDEWYGVFFLTARDQMIRSENVRLYVPVTCNPAHRYRFFVDHPFVTQHLIVSPLEEGYERSIRSYLKTQDPDIVAGKVWFIPNIQPDQYEQLLTGWVDYPWLSQLAVVGIHTYWAQREFQPMVNFLEGDINPIGTCKRVRTYALSFEGMMRILFAVMATVLLYKLAM